MISHVVPFLYFRRTRAPNAVQLLSWVVLLPVPALIASFSFSMLGPGETFLLFALEFVSLFTVYELGYIENDTVGVVGETNPTLRVGPEETSRIAHRRPAIYLGRFATVALLQVPAIVLFGRTGANVAVYPVVLAGTLAVFAVYNRVRSRWNLPVYFLLVSLRCYSPGYVFLSPGDFLPYLALTSVVYPLPSLLEWASRPRYGLKWLAGVAGNTDSFRVKYYATLFSVVSLLMLLGNTTRGLPVCWILTVYFMVYRSVCLIALKRRPDIESKLTERGK